MKEIQIWEFIKSHLNNNNQVILAVVLDHKKGSPGKQGFKMAVSSDGETAGSIGGGIMEYKIIEKCREYLKKDIIFNRLETVFHNKKKDVKNSGLICSGSQTNFTFSLKKKDIKNVSKILNALKKRKPGKMIFTRKGISYHNASKNSDELFFEYKNDNDWKFEQTTLRKNIVYVAGGGHVGIALCKVLSLLDFYIIIYDSRNELKKTYSELFAHKIIIDSFSNLSKAVEDDSYIVIVTTGFESDKEALMQVIGRKVKYIGLMGTNAKIKKIFSELRKEGISGKLLNKIHAPVGIDINSNTPEEIAVSIASEIIREKNKDL